MINNVSGYINKFRAMEEAGLTEAVHLGFVVAAGGVGDRLRFGGSGYSGIKLDLPSEITTGASVLQVLSPLTIEGAVL